MSNNIGRLPITIPTNILIKIIKFNLPFYSLVFVGNKATKSIIIPNNIKSIINNNTLLLDGSSADTPEIWGTLRVHIANAIKGATEGYSIKLNIIGIGYKVEYTKPILTLNIGKSHPLKFIVPEDIKITQINSSSILGMATSKEKLHSFFNQIKLKKSASKDRYKGKGIALEPL